MSITSYFSKFIPSVFPNASKSFLDVQKNDSYGGIDGLGAFKLSARPIDHSRKAETSLPSLIEAQSLELMLKQPIHLQASKLNLNKLADMVFTSATDTVNKLKACDIRGVENLGDELSKLKIKFEGEGVATKSDIKACKVLSKKLTKTILDSIRKNVSAKDFKRFKLECDIKNELRINFSTTLGKNKELWEPLQKTLKISPVPGGQFRTYQSNMIPASRLAALTENYKRNALYGVSSMSTQETRHAVNLWTTEFKGSDVEFKGVRHGVNMPFGEKDPQKQLRGADQRTYEVITAAADVKREAIQKHIEKYGTEAPFTLTIVSSSLLTPSEGLKYKKYELGQQDAWKRAIQQSKNGDLIVKVPNENGGLQEVKVKLNVLPFSFGVNGLAKLKSSAPIALKLLNSFPNVDVSGWKWADKHNAPLFDELLTSALKIKKEGHEVEYDRIQAYVAQIKEIINSGKHHKDKGNAYAMPVLVSLLSNELGFVPAWNCMSGKDRTGYLDAKIKETLVIQDQGSGVTVLDQFSERTKRHPEILEKIIFESGSLEIQRACTGVAGYKVNEGRQKIMGKEIDLSVQSNRKNLQPAAAALLEGLSGAVNA